MDPSIYDPIDFAMMNLALYSFILFILVENAYQVVKALQKRKLKRYVLGEKSLLDLYPDLSKLPPEELEKIRGSIVTKIIEKEIDGSHVINLVLIAALISFTFLPYTIFHWLPWGPNYEFLEIVYNGLFFGMAASTSYNVSQMFGQLVLSLIGRLRAR